MIKNGQSIPKEFCETADIRISSCGEQAEIAQMDLADKVSIRSAEAGKHLFCGCSKFS